MPGGGSVNVGLPDSISLDGTWDFVPGDDPSGPSAPIEVPGVWEAAGYPDLDGGAWYRRTFELAETEGRWTLAFGAVMDEAEVFVNGIRVGAHKGAFTPFRLDITEAVRRGSNDLAVHVHDIARTDPRHAMSAHGKQGWMNHVFPSPPSLYMTYGGIWQSVTLERHGEVRIEDIWIDSDPDDLTVEIEMAGSDGVLAELNLSLLGATIVRSIRLEGGSAVVRVAIGPVDAARWSPSSPVMHDAHVSVRVEGHVSDARRSAFGLRTVRMSREGLVVNEQLVKIKSALVQGFRADTLYAEGSRDAIAAEVLAAKDAGLNMLRLHIKAFDPRYLTVCDEVGMLVHCDIPVAEPIAHDALAADGALAEAAADAARAQVRRDRNHPSIILWSAMNELGAEALESRKTRGYEGFARRLHETVSSVDPTRPVIENDWIEPDPEEVFLSPVLTAHWYGRLSASYLATLRAKAEQWAGGDRPLFVSEFGDWGLPELDDERDEFWAYGSSLAGGIRSSAWPGEVDAFVEGTHRYQGLADRLQIELFRTTPGVVGWCVTELTDVPQEFNGLLDLDRNPKNAAMVEIARATQPLLPVIRRTSWTAAAGTTFEDEVVLVNDGPGLADCRLRLRVGASEVDIPVGVVEADSISAPVRFCVRVPDESGVAALEVVVLDGSHERSANCYPLHVVRSPERLGRVVVVGDGGLQRALASLGAEISTDGDTLLVVGENRLDLAAAERIDGRLREGGDVLVLAQTPAVAKVIPLPAAMSALATGWGSTPFVFTTDAGRIGSLPAQTVLSTEILEVTPDSVWTALGGPGTHVETVVGVFKPFPHQVVGTAVGRLRVHEGTLTVCQLPLTGLARAGNPLARALLGDIVVYANAPLEVS